MGVTDVIVILVIALIIGGASYYIYRAKKAGHKCIGCPNSTTCGKYNDSVSSCGGNCSFCTSCSSGDEEKTK